MVCPKCGAWNYREKKSIIQIDVYPDMVVFDQEEILKRPARIAPSVWMAYWERIKGY